MVIMGERDPDFPDPSEEATWIAETLNGSVAMVPEAGHYPQSQQPGLTAEAVLSFLATLKLELRQSGEGSLTTRAINQAAESTSNGTVSGTPRMWLRIEAAALLSGALIAYSTTGQHWWLVPVVVLLP